VRHGEVYIHLVEPALRYAEMLVNGRTQMLRDGERLVVSGLDKVKMEKVVTNLDSLGGVFFRMTEVDPQQGEYEIRFLRGDQTFATTGPAIVRIGSATGVGSNGATLTRSVDPSGHSTQWYFQYGRTT